MSYSQKILKHYCLQSFNGAIQKKIFQTWQIHILIFCSFIGRLCSLCSWYQLKQNELKEYVCFSTAWKQTFWEIQLHFLNHTCQIRTMIVHWWPVDGICPPKHAGTCACQPFSFYGRAAASHPLVWGHVALPHRVSETMPWVYVKTLDTSCLKIQFYFRRGKKWISCHIRMAERNKCILFILIVCHFPTNTCWRCGWDLCEK